MWTNSGACGDQKKENPGAGVTGWHWEPNLDSLQKKFMLFTAVPSVPPPAPAC